MHSTATPTPRDLESAYQSLRRPALRQARCWFPTLSQTDLEDLYQSAWLSLLRSQSEVADVEPYLYWAVYSQGLMELRRQRRSSPHLADRQNGGTSVGGDARPPAEPESVVDRTAPLPGEQAETRVLVSLAEEILDELTPRERSAVKLRWGWELSREEIAGLLGTTARTVKRDIKTAGSKISAETQAIEQGRWCRRKRSLITGYALRLLGPARDASAERHLRGCSACRQLVRELRSRADEVAALAPAPALAGPPAHGLIGRIVDSVEAMRAHAVDLASSAKHQATSLAVRTTDPTPLSGIRPGAATAAVAGCLAIGGGATYCIEQGVSPVNELGGLVGSQEAKDKREPKATSQQPDQPVAPDTPTSAPTPPEGGSLPAAPVQPGAQPPPAPPPSPAEEFEPSSPPARGATRRSGRASAATAGPAPAPATDPGEFDGP